MIIEHFKTNKIKEVYTRFDKKGRMLPDGVHYINSWTSDDLNYCYQLMESESIEKLQKWIVHWDDLVDFEIVPLISFEEAKEKVLNS